MGLTNAGALLLAADVVGEAITEFNNANAAIGVGDSATAFAATQTDMVAATNKLRKAMESTYPQRAGAALTFRSLFATGDANWAWNEWGVFNAVSGAGTAGPTGVVMLNRKQEALGTKTSAQSWQFTVTLTVTAA